MKRIILISLALLLGLVSFYSLAEEKRWYYVSATCSNCEADGHRTRSGERGKLRNFFSNVIYVDEFSYDCKEGAFYDVTGMSGTESYGYESRSKAARARSKSIGRSKRSGFIIHTIHLEEYPDCS